MTSSYLGGSFFGFNNPFANKTKQIDVKQPKLCPNSNSNSNEKQKWDWNAVFDPLQKAIGNPKTPKSSAQPTPKPSSKPSSKPILKPMSAAQRPTKIDKTLEIANKPISKTASIPKLVIDDDTILKIHGYKIIKKMAACLQGQVFEGKIIKKEMMKKLNVKN
eukprot:206665_1